MVGLSEILEKVKDILAEEVGERKVFDKDIATALAITQAAFATMKNRGKIPYPQLVEFCARRRISVNWLLYDQDPSSLIEPTNRYSYVRYFPEVSASAGGGAENLDEGYTTLQLDETMYAMLGSDRSIDAVNVVGDSMEPTLHDGDIVFIDREKKDFRKGGVYTVATPHGIFVKRLQIRVDGQVDIISDNGDYPAQTIPAEEVGIIGKVVGVFGRVE